MEMTETQAPSAALFESSALPPVLAPVTLTVTMDVIRAYGTLTDDFNPIHTDPVFAATTPMQGVIAHGTLSICLLWESVQQSLPSRVFDDLTLDVRFVKPVRVGEVLTAGGERQADSYAVWVLGPDGADRLNGRIHVGTWAAVPA